MLENAPSPLAERLEAVQLFSLKVMLFAQVPLRQPHAWPWLILCYRLRL